MRSVAIPNQKLISYFSVALFLQIYIGRNILFETNWDAGQIMYTVFSVHRGEGAADWYFSMYNNNFLVIGIFYALFKINRIVGLSADWVESYIMTAVLVNSLLLNIAYRLVYKITYMLCHNKIWSLIAYGISVFLVGLSPWLVIPYSDAMAAIFPILILYLYMSPTKNSYIKGIIFGVIMCLAYHLKPQAAIIGIAIILFELLSLLDGINKEKLPIKLKATAFFIIVFSVLALGINTIIPDVLNMNLNDNDKLGMLHFVVLGLNEETHGMWSGDDINYALSFNYGDERNQAEIQRIKERLQKMGMRGYIKLIIEKTKGTFGDATFALGVEGNYYLNIYPDVNEAVSPFLKSFLYSIGENFIIYGTICQFLYIFVLIGCIVYGISQRKKIEDVSLILMLSFMGLFIFETLFEARARYIFTSIPLFIVMAAVGMSWLFDKCMKESDFSKILHIGSTNV